uniref:Uncharacterized protein n=1 Tax=Physcomitrium patens TaxID=3218 RepID=A0A7I4CLD6_PHYPA
MSLNRLLLQQISSLQVAAASSKVFGFKKLEASQLFGDFHVTWLHLSPIYSLHVVERDPKLRLLESPFVVPSDANVDVSALWPGPHLSF